MEGARRSCIGSRAGSTISGPGGGGVSQVLSVFRTKMTIASTALLYCAVFELTPMSQWNVHETNSGLACSSQRVLY